MSLYSQMQVFHGVAIMKISKRILCFVLTAVFVLPCVLLAADKTSAVYPEETPIIYIHGEGTPIGTFDENGEFHRMDNLSPDTDKLVSLLSDNKEMLLKAFVTQDWSDFCALVENFMVDSFGHLALGTDGMPKDDSVAIAGWGQTEVPASESYIRERYTGNDDSLNKFTFWYDWRLDPTDNMERLHDFAELVLKVTGSEKYAIVGRCEGACLALTYWETYHDTRISDIIFYASAAKGAIPVGEAFSGSFYIDPDAVERFVYEADLNINYEISDNLTFTDRTLNAILKTASDMYGLDYACWAVNNVYQQIYDKVTPGALKETFATFPGFWAMCEDKYYEKAKEVIFGGDEEEYAVLIDKIDNYHYNIMNRSDEIIRHAVDSGVEVSNVVKYGFQSYPLSEDSDIQSDQMCRVDCAGFGTSCTKIGETFGDDYLRKAVSKGGSRYISPDMTVDASTSILKDTTWYVRNLTHSNFTDAMDGIFFKIAGTPGMTVTSDPEYPQYLFYEPESDTVHPYNAETDKSDSDEFNEQQSKDFARRLKPLFRILFRIITFVTKMFTLPARA